LYRKGTHTRKYQKLKYFTTNRNIMDSIEERYCAMKSITCIALVIGLMMAFGSLLSLESLKLEKCRVRIR
jgi:hypothetical protein